MWIILRVKDSKKKSKYAYIMAVFSYNLYIISNGSIFGINGKIDSLSDSDDFGEEVIYSTSLQRWRNFSETLTGIWIGLLSTDRLSQEKKHYQLKNHFRFRVGTEIVFDLKWES